MIIYLQGQLTLDGKNFLEMSILNHQLFTGEYLSFLLG